MIASLRGDGIRRGLSLAVRGHLTLFLLVGAGSVLLTPAGKPVIDRFELTPEDVDLVARCLIGLGAVLGYLLILLGQWRCLAHAPQGHAAKDLMFAGLLSSVVAAVLPGVVLIVGTDKPAASPPGEFAWMAKGNLLQAGNILKVSCVVLILLGFLMFNAFARATARHFGDEKRARGVTVFFWFAAFMIGATVGMLLHERGTLQRDVLIGLGAGWVFLLLWQAVQLQGVARCITLSLERQSNRDGEHPRNANQGRVVLRAGVYVRDDE